MISNALDVGADGGVGTVISCPMATLFFGMIEPGQMWKARTYGDQLS